MMTAQVVWHGTDDEAAALLKAVAHNCTCEYDEAQIRKRMCSAHAAMICEQRFMDGLLFMRRKAACLRREEWRS